MKQSHLQLTYKIHTKNIRDRLEFWLKAKMRLPFLQVRTFALARNQLILDRREAILALAPQLEQVAERCGQPGAMHWLPYFLHRGVTRFRAPLLVLTLRKEVQDRSAPHADDIHAVALLFEYRLLGVRTGIVATADAVGFNSIVAPSGQRAHVAISAAKALLQRGATIVFSTYESADEPGVNTLSTRWPAITWAWRERQVGRMLPLHRTFDQTLALFGKSTRFNLRYYRRKLLKDVGCEYVPVAGPLLQQEDLLALNRRSLNPVEQKEFDRRVQSASSLAGSYLCGLRSSDGQWLSLIGGWRQGGTTVLYWQMNALGFERYSLGTAMRSFYLEDEIARGAQRLLIYGGTSHTMRHAFQQEPVADLIVQRRGLRTTALRHLARFLGSQDRRFGRQNFLVDTLQSPELQWNSGNQPEDAPEATAGSSESRKIA